MLDKNNIEIRTGMIVRITGAYFANDNGLYLVEHSPGDPGWAGSDYSLLKVGRSGKPSKAKHHICFWPIAAFSNSRAKRDEADAWNEAHAQIEVQSVRDMAEAKDYFRRQGDELAPYIDSLSRDYGADCAQAAAQRQIQAHWYAIADAIGQEAAA